MQGQPTTSMQRPVLPRWGFSIVELMVVISIIALIMSALGLVLANYLQSARIQATRATITKIDAILKQRMNNLRQQDFTDAGNRLVLSLKTGSTSLQISQQAGRILALKQRLRAAFPQQRADNSTGTANPPAPFDKITDVWVTNNPDAESAAYLYAIIVNGATFGTPTVDESFFTSRESRTVDGVTFFIDAWGEPLQYYRAPTRLFWKGDFDADGDGNIGSNENDMNGDGNVTFADQTHLQNVRAILTPGVRLTSAGSVIDPYRIDPDDPLNSLATFINRLGPINYEATFQTPSCYSTPLIVSRGPDRELGLEVPLNVAVNATVAAARRANPTATVLGGTYDALTDNITNLNSQSLGGN